MKKHGLIGGLFAIGVMCNAVGGTFVSIQDPVCINSNPGFSTGEQYNDYNNGILFGEWFMLPRWQANESDFTTHNVAYDVGKFTGLHSAMFQKGLTPEDINGSSAVQISCYDSGMLINTWETPHRPILGGGYNDMFGFSFSSPPTAFVDGSTPTDLVLQSNIAVPNFSVVHNVSGNHLITGAVGLFAYLRDNTNPNSPPIAVLAITHSSTLIDYSLPPGTDRNEQQGYLYHGLVSADYSASDTNTAKTSYPYWLSSAPSNGSGVWFVSAPISSTNDQRYVTKVYSDGDDNTNLVPVSDLSAPLTFWRAHITPTNLVNIVTDINSAACGTSQGNGTCPPRPAGGYSTNPAAYVLLYAGVIAENGLTDGMYDTSRTSWTGMPGGSMPYSDTTKDQVAMAVHIYGPGIYRYEP